MPCSEITDLSSPIPRRKGHHSFVSFYLRGAYRAFGIENLLSILYNYFCTYSSACFPTTLELICLPEVVSITDLVTYRNVLITNLASSSTDFTPTNIDGQKEDKKVGVQCDGHQKPLTAGIKTKSKYK